MVAESPNNIKNRSKNKQKTDQNKDLKESHKKIKKFKSEWKSAVCYNSKNMAKITRETLDELGFEYERERSYKSYSKLMVVLPLPKFSYIFQFKISEPAQFIINIYDTKPTHSGDLHFHWG